MKLFDIILELDDIYNIIRIQFFNQNFKETYGPTWSQYIGLPLSEVSEIHINAELGQLEWKNEKFCYNKLKAGNNKTFMFLKANNDREFLYEQAMEHVPYPLSIYDKSAFLLYMNAAARKIWNFQSNSDISGKHLLDLFEVDRQFSTVLTTLKNGSPIIDRIDNYYSTNGSQTLTSNTGFPVHKGEEIAGVLILEHDLEDIDSQIKHLENLRARLSEHAGPAKEENQATGYTFDSIVGHGHKLAAAVSLAKKIAIQDCSVLLVGETGTGKEIFAQSIHKASLRKSKNFVAVNCAAFPDTLIESLLFGTAKGSFTGSTDKPGLFEEANGGTLFLDELNSMSLSMQSKILRVIQEGVFRRVGSQKDLTTDVRIIASCNADPFQLISENALRKDLFYRLSTVMIELPALRDHINDIEELVYYHISRRSRGFAKRIDSLSPEVLDLFRHYNWPGNVRELFHVIDYALNTMEGSTIELSHLPTYLQTQKMAAPIQPAQVQLMSDEELLHSDLQHIMDKYEEQVIRKVLEHHGYNISRAAEALGIRRQSLQYRIRKLGIII